MFVSVPYSSEFEYICTYCMDSIYDVFFLCSTCIKFILCKQCVVHGVELGEHKNTHGLKPVDLGNYVLFDLSGVPQRQWKVRFALRNNEQDAKHKPKAGKHKQDIAGGSKEACLKSILKVKLSTEEKRRLTIAPSQVKYHNIFMTICRNKSQKKPEEFEQLVRKLNGYIAKCREQHRQKIQEKRSKVQDAIQAGESPETISALKRSNKCVFKVPDTPHTKPLSLNLSAIDNDIRRSSRVKHSPKSKDISPTRRSLSKAKDMKVKIKLRKKLGDELDSCIVVQKDDVNEHKEDDDADDEDMEDDTKMEVDRPPGKKAIVEKRVTRSKKTKCDKKSKKSSKRNKDDTGGPRKLMNSKQKQSVKHRLILLKNRATERKRATNRTKISIAKNKRSFGKVLRAKMFIDPKIIEQDLLEVEKELGSKNVAPLSKGNSYKELLKKNRRKLWERKQTLPKNAHIVSPVDKQWQAWEEMQLLDAIEKFGYGNWKAIAEEMQDEVCITAKAVAEHYFVHYVLFDVGDCTLKWKKNAHLIRKMLDRQSMFRQRVPNLSSLISDAEHNFKFNYKPKRDDFEPDVDSDFENVVANMLPDTENVTKLDMKLQVAHMEMYKLIIRERQYSKYIIREYELLRKFIFQHPKKKLKISETENNVDVGAFKVLLRFASRDHLQKLYLSLHKEFFLKLMIRILLRFKNLGVVSLEQLIEYKRSAQFGDRIQQAKLFTVGENELLAQDYETLRTMLELESTEQQEIFIEQILPYLIGRLDGNFFNKLQHDDTIHGKSPKKTKFALDERIEQWMSLADCKHEYVEGAYGKLSNAITKREEATCGISQCSASRLLDLKALVLNEFRSCADSTHLRDNAEHRSQRQVELLRSISDDVCTFLTHLQNLQINLDV